MAVNIYSSVLAAALLLTSSNALSYSTFTGKQVNVFPKVPSHATSLTMRKQKASDKRTRRMQRNQKAVLEPGSESLPLHRSANYPLTPLETSAWNHKSIPLGSMQVPPAATGGRGRSRKRSTVYSNLASYHTQFLELLTAEFLAEVGHCVRLQLQLIDAVVVVVSHDAMTMIIYPTS